MSPAPLKVLVVDDSAFYRKVVRMALEAIPDVVVVGTASNGRAAIERILTDPPDVVTVDLEMPELDGLGMLRELSERRIVVRSIVVSALSAEGARTTTAALGLGAFDFIVKPSAGGVEANVAQLQSDLAPRIEAARTASMCAVRPAPRPVAAAIADKPARPAAPRTALPPQVIGIGVSTGGPLALRRLLPQLPADYPLPIVVVQHMPPIFTKTLADDLNRACPLEVVEGCDAMAVKPGRVIIAPGGRQMRIVKDNACSHVRITDDPPERNCRPAVDYLFRSIAEQYGGHAWGVILTGMGDDGVQGCTAMRALGATILAQDEATCVVYGMPRAVAHAGVVDIVAPIDAIAQRFKDAASSGGVR